MSIYVSFYLRVSLCLPLRPFLLYFSIPFVMHLSISISSSFSLCLSGVFLLFIYLSFFVSLFFYLLYFSVPFVIPLSISISIFFLLFVHSLSFSFFFYSLFFSSKPHRYWSRLRFFCSGNSLLAKVFSYTPHTLSSFVDANLMSYSPGLPSSLVLFVSSFSLVSV